VKRDPYPKEEFEAALKTLRLQTDILAKLTEAMLRHRAPILKAVGPIAVAAEGSCKSVILLVEHDEVRDAFVCARTALLSIINACFILAEGQAAADRAERHAIQKAVRDLDRVTSTKDIRIVIRWSGADDLKRQFPELDALLREFEWQSGKEKTKWTDENENQKIESITRKYGDRLGAFLLFGMAAIYTHASEIAHGTLFGEHWHLGFASPGDYPLNREELNLGPRKRAFTMLSVLSFSVFALIEILGREFPDVKNYSSEADEIMKGFVRMIRPPKS
jgi:hypothetical protein